MEFLTYVADIMPALLKGLLVTLKLFGYTVVCALPLGLLISLMSISKIHPIKWLAKIYILVLRGTPLMLQLFFVYFILPRIGITLDRFDSAATAFILNYAAYFAEIYRGGIESVDHGQYDAAKALGFNTKQTMSLIVIPQMLRSIIPPISNEVITLIKDTALVTVLGVHELLQAARSAVNRDVTPMPYLVVACMYLVMVMLMTFVFGRIEKKLSKHNKR